ncbi:unannotated protein [freshwater metagenome]|uniref:Unannotated protein n=1 Tax=freshwater metagenome TaxID=449393 RepID=A0A6J7RIN7_9ZZZZ
MFGADPEVVAATEASESALPPERVNAALATSVTGPDAPALLTTPAAPETVPVAPVPPAPVGVAPLAAPPVVAAPPLATAPPVLAPPVLAPPVLTCPPVLPPPPSPPPAIVVGGTLPESTSKLVTFGLGGAPGILTISFSEMSTICCDSGA